MLDSLCRPSLLGLNLPRVSRPEASNHSHPSNMQVWHCTVPKGYSHFVTYTVRCHTVTARAVCSYHFYSLTGWSMLCEALCVVYGYAHIHTHPHTSCHLWQINSLCVQGWYSRAHLSLLCTRAGCNLGFTHSYANTNLSVFVVLSLDCFGCVCLVQLFLASLSSTSCIVSRMPVSYLRWR